MDILIKTLPVIFFLMLAMIIIAYAGYKKKKKINSLGDSEAWGEWININYNGFKLPVRAQDLHLWNSYTTSERKLVVRKLKTKLRNREVYLHYPFKDKPKQAVLITKRQSVGLAGLCSFQRSDSDVFDFYVNNKKEHRWRRTSRNGNIVGASSEGYKNKADCIENAERNGFDKSVHKNNLKYK